MNAYITKLETKGRVTMADTGICILHMPPLCVRKRNSLLRLEEYLQLFLGSLMSNFSLPSSVPEKYLWNPGTPAKFCEMGMHYTFV